MATWTVPHYARTAVGDVLTDTQDFKCALAARSSAHFF